MILDILQAIVTWVFLIAIRLPLILAGLVIVPIGLLFRTTEEVTNPDELTYPERKVVHMPKIFWLWDNDAEGAMSWMDEWPDMCWDKDPTSFLSMFQWMAIRNPVNNMRFTKGIAAYLPHIESIRYYGDRYVSDKYQAGFQFVISQGKIFKYYGLVWVKNIGSKKLVIRIGHKLRPDHLPVPEGIPYRKLWKGMTFRIGIKDGNV